MKIEKINENQIRCTLTRADLDDRQLKLSELAYGTEKAKSLFREMMQQASYEFGFEAEDIPLMIEAIPLSADTIVFLITKVEYPEELDTRFSKFSEPSDDFDDILSDDSSSGNPQGADDILDLFKQIQQENEKTGRTTKAAEQTAATKDTTADVRTDSAETDTEAPVHVPLEISKLFAFNSLETVGKLAVILKGFYDDSNTLYRKPGYDQYLLVICKGHHTPEEFNKVCNILAEYGVQKKYTHATEAYFMEHYDMLIDDHALQILAKI